MVWHNVGTVLRVHGSGGELAAAAPVSLPALPRPANLAALQHWHSAGPPVCHEVGS